MQITIFSRGPSLYSTRRLVEAARASGCTTAVVDHGQCVSVLKAGKPALWQNGAPIALPDVAILRIGSNMTSRGAALIRQLDLLGVRRTLDAEALLLARDKMACLQRLAGAGLPVPATVLCHSIGEAREAVSSLGHYPVVVKLVESTHGIGVALARNLFELDRVVGAFLGLHDRILLQEFVRESRGRDWRAFVVGDRVVASMERRAAAGDFRSNLHRGGRASSLALDKDVRQLAVRAAQLTGVEIAGVDILPSQAGPLVIEVNASPGLEGIEGTTGINVAGQIVEYAIKKL